MVFFMEGKVIVLQGNYGECGGNVSGGIGSDQIIKVLDCHTKELGHYSVDNEWEAIEGFMEVSAIIHFAF